MSSTKFIEKYVKNTQGKDLRGFAHGLNAHLRGELCDNNLYSEAIKGLTQEIKNHSSKSSETLFRGTYSYTLDSFLDNNIYTYPAFLSFTSNKDVVQNFFDIKDDLYYPILFELEQHCELARVDVNTVLEYDYYENEFLIDKGSNFQIISRCKITGREMEIIMGRDNVWNYVDIPVILTPRSGHIDPPGLRLQRT